LKDYKEIFFNFSLTSFVKNFLSEGMWNGEILLADFKLEHGAGSQNVVCITLILKITDSEELLQMIGL